VPELQVDIPLDTVHKPLPQLFFNFLFSKDINKEQSKDINKEMLKGEIKKLEKEISELQPIYNN
jgi:hypothetical protein